MRACLCQSHRHDGVVAYSANDAGYLTRACVDRRDATDEGESPLQPIVGVGTGVRKQYFFGDLVRVGLRRVSENQRNTDCPILRARASADRQLWRG